MNVWRQEGRDFPDDALALCFTNVLLSDEINRAPPKTHVCSSSKLWRSAKSPSDGATLSLDLPFVVIATQNPIEQEGTYPLPEAQLDRFLLKLSAGYPANAALENDILLRRIHWQKDDPTADIEPAVDVRRFVGLQRSVETGVYTDRLIVDYITQLVRLSREHPRVAVGVSPRGGLALLRASRAMALIHGRDFVVPDDVKMLVPDVLAHRIILNIEDTLEGVRGDLVVEELLSQVPVPGEIERTAP